MESRVCEATRRHEAGYNCAQAVACAYADVFGVEEEALFAATEGLGLGMGGMEGTCGALSGACVLAGLAHSCRDLGHPTSKRETYALSRAMVARFAELSGATRCRDLKGVGAGRPLCSCAQCVENGAQVVEEVLLSGEAGA